ncbi:MAG: PAS domain S-box protein [Flavisolibacter sp.]
MTSLRKIDFEFSFFELTPDLVCIAGKEGYFRKINQAVVDTLEYTEEELYALPIASFIHPEDKGRTHRKRASLLEGETLVNFENRYLTKTGKTVWLHWTSIYFPEREVVLAIAKNVTEKKQAEIEIAENYEKFKGLASHFKTSLEKDKKYLAAELHEDLAQLTTTLIIDLDWMRDNMQDPSPASRNRLDHALEVATRLVGALRRISYSISPSMLEDLGLDETLEWLCKEFTLIHGIPCLFESHYDTESLSKETQLDFFRICQEALDNISQHAGASSVRVSIEPEGDEICLMIRDDGKGFEPGQETEKQGLVDMRKRAASLNGSLHVKTAPGKGTCICVRIDLRRKPDSR